MAEAQFISVKSLRVKRLLILSYLQLMECLFRGINEVGQNYIYAQGQPVRCDLVPRPELNVIGGIQVREG